MENRSITINRIELYEQVWNEPVSKVAPKYGIQEKSRRQNHVLTEKDKAELKRWSHAFIKKYDYIAGIVMACVRSTAVRSCGAKKDSSIGIR
jgi:hypothetical protein